MKFVCALGLWTGLFLVELSSTTAFAKNCSYALDTTAAQLTWTAYKFTNKTPVVGTFEIINFTQNTQATSVEDLFKSVKFNIETASISTGMPYRDKKLALFLFGAIKKPAEITGKIFGFNAESKTADAELTMNGRHAKVKFNFTQDPATQKHIFQGELDILDFKMHDSMKRLTAACKDLHTGDDGVAKTWSTVSLEVAALVKETCIVQP